MWVHMACDAAFVDTMEITPHLFRVQLIDGLFFCCSTCVNPLSNHTVKLTSYFVYTQCFGLVNVIDLDKYLVLDHYNFVTHCCSFTVFRDRISTLCWSRQGFHEHCIFRSFCLKYNFLICVLVA